MRTIPNLTRRQRQKYRDKQLAIHRYISVSRLFEILRDKRLHFADAAIWPDPFEKYMTDDIPGARSAEADTGGFCYFSCWTLANESDHLWRLYTPNTDGVRVTVMLHALAEAYPSWTIRGVEYLPTDRIKARIQQYKSQRREPSLRHFDKRLAFKAEEELRIMIRGGQNDWGSDDYITHDFDTKLVSSVLFDPRMDEELFRCLSAYLKKTYKLAAAMKHSRLYRPEKIFGAQQRPSAYS